jgi:hypothetical protein
MVVGQTKGVASGSNASNQAAGTAPAATPARSSRAPRQAAVAGSEFPAAPHEQSGAVRHTSAPQNRLPAVPADTHIGPSAAAAELAFDEKRARSERVLKWVINPSPAPLNEVGQQVMQQAQELEKASVQMIQNIADLNHKITSVINEFSENNAVHKVGIDRFKSQMQKQLKAIDNKMIDLRSAVLEAGDGPGNLDIANAKLNRIEADVDKLRKMVLYIKEGVDNSTARQSTGNVGDAGDAPPSKKPRL